MAPGFDPFLIQSDADVVSSAYDVPLDFAPEEQWEYCNVGYIALAEIIRTVSGRPWSEFLTERVFAPAGMQATRTTTTTERIANRAVGYTDNDELLEAVDWPSVRAARFSPPCSTSRNGTPCSIATTFSPARRAAGCGRRLR